MTKYKVGNIVEGSVTGIESYGDFVNLDEYYSGLIHISEISHGFVKNINDFVNVGETIRVKVIDVDEESCHVKLSVKDINYRNVSSKRMKIEEVGSGFEILHDNLDCWIEEKLKEIE